MSENKVPRKIYEPRRDDRKITGQKYIMESFITG
jgi:hypothetical protein